jgi:PAS domain S-box-containing protein
VSVEGGGQDELGRLITGFNDMLRAVQERETALAQARDQLEARVRERTRELEQEIAERKAAQKAMQDKELKLIEAQQIAQLGSWEWDPATNAVEWSDELYRITGVLPNRFSGKLPEAVLVAHPEDRKVIQDAMEKSRAEREPFQAEIRIIRPDGSIRFIRVHGKPVLDDAGKTVRLIGTVQDITERKRSESAIQKLNEELSSRVEEAAAANKELEGFSYSVSHDLRAPLRAIHGYSRMLMEDYADRVDGDGKRFLEVISQNTRRMGQLIDDLLDFSRLGRKALLMSPVDMAALVKQVCDEAVAAAPDRRLEFRTGDLPPAHGDASMLRIAVTNLVSNAVKYSKGRDPAVIEIGSRADGGDTAYFVKDNGVGFEMEYAHKLFGVFQRLHRAEDFEGTGVGLALVQRIIQRHGGRVTAEGRVGSGATFTFFLPGRPAGVEGV